MAKKRKTNTKVKVTYADGRTETLPYKYFLNKKKGKRWYLKTDHWKKLRKKAKIRDNFKCVQCGVSGVRLEVHHKTYENAGREKLEDVITLCQPCHAKKHKNMDKIREVERHRSNDDWARAIMMKILPPDHKELERIREKEQSKI